MRNHHLAGLRSTTTPITYVGQLHRALICYALLIQASSRNRHGKTRTTPHRPLPARLPYGLALGVQFQI
jgi:hypothetical protein